MSPFDYSLKVSKHLKGILKIAVKLIIKCIIFLINLCVCFVEGGRILLTDKLGAGIGNALIKTCSYACKDSNTKSAALFRIIAGDRHSEPRGRI